MSKNLQLYQKYYVSKGSENLELFRLLKGHYGIGSAIYPGSFVHITPSLVFPKTAYIDNDRRVAAFFADPQVLAWVQTNKEYKRSPEIIAFQQNYSNKTPSDIGQYDLLISQYAGFVSQDCKQYLKSGGILLVNNSHADAGLAYLDPDYELIGVANQTREKWRIDDALLDTYFKPKSGDHPSREKLLETMRGIGYTKTAQNYLFKKLFK